MLVRFGRRFPKHFGPAHLARAEKAFERWGVWAVFFGRFVALAAAHPTHGWDETEKRLVDAGVFDTA